MNIIKPLLKIFSNQISQIKLALLKTGAKIKLMPSKQALKMLAFVKLE
jgi:hypothetical protein